MSEVAAAVGREDKWVVDWFVVVGGMTINPRVGSVAVPGTWMTTEGLS